MRQGQGCPARLPDAPTAQLTQYIFFARQAADHLKTVRIDLIRQMDRLWPGALVNVKRFKQAHPDLPPPKPIVTTKPLERDTLRVLLHYCPNPYHVRQLGVDGLIALFHEHHVRCGPQTAQRILHCANHALLNLPSLVEVYIQGLQQLLADEAHWLDRLRWAEAHLDAIVHATPARHLISLRGLSPTWAAYYLNLVGAPPHFDWADQVWAYVGFDPIETQSGDSNPAKRFTISKRGEAFYRHMFTWMACLVAAHHPTFGQAFIAAEQRGLGTWGAAIHVAHKLNRVCFRLLLDDRPFHDETHPDDFARWNAYWLAYRQHRRDPKKKNHPGTWTPTRQDIHPLC